MSRFLTIKKLNFLRLTGFLLTTGLVLLASKVEANPIRKALQGCVALSKDGFFNKNDLMCSIHYLYSKTPGEPFQNVESSLKALLENPEFRRKCKLTENEITAVFAYTHRAYRPINKQLRSGGDSIPADMSPMVGALISALDNIEPYEGRLFRTTNLPELRLREMQLGRVIQTEAFVSTSLKNPAGLSDQKIGNHHFEILSKTGRPIYELSLYPSEKEVIFPPGTNFEVVDVSKIDLNCEIRFLLKETEVGDLTDNLDSK